MEVEFWRNVVERLTNVSKCLLEDTKTEL